MINSQDNIFEDEIAVGPDWAYFKKKEKHTHIRLESQWASWVVIEPSNKAFNT